VRLEPVQLLLGPLAGPECRRALGRGKWKVLRALAAIPALLALLVAVWAWWLFDQFSPPFPGVVPLRTGLTAVLWMSAAVALILGPAVLAGALAGEKDRGTLAMLLASRVSPREIVLAKLASRLSIVAVLLLAGVGAGAVLAWLEPIPWRLALLHVALPLAVAFGSGGLALAASAIARRGRDALMAVYFLDLALFLGPLFGINFIPPTVSDWLVSINPFVAGYRLVWEWNATPALIAISVWMFLGLAAVTWASLRMAPVYLRQLDGAGQRRKALRRRQRDVSDEHPMLWKELHIEQGQKFRGVLRWLGWLLVAVVLGTSAGLLTLRIWISVVGAEMPGGLITAGRLTPPQAPLAPVNLPQLPGWAETLFVVLQGWAALSALPLSWLIQWAIGMRAAVSIASEREQHTWDTLLTSPLEGHEIVWPKIGGSLWAMRGLLAVAVMSWTVAAICGAIAPGNFIDLLSFTFVLGTFMAAVGVWASLSSATVMRSITLALGIWLAALLGTYVVAFFLTAIVALVIALAHLWAAWIGLRPFNSAPPSPVSFGTGMQLFRLAMYAGGAMLLGWYCRQSFDALAGRTWGRRLRYVPGQSILVEAEPQRMA
jgi:ABC-type transport system involved in multi-copper enzyme maturation permease subunit